ncbi:MAG: hypothetical protein ABSG91_10575 [Syntrophobacteraceae bacterium]
MVNQEELEKVDFELDFPKDCYANHAPEEESRFAPLKRLRNLKLLRHILEKVGKGGKLVVQFDVPKAVANGLKTGVYIRKGGVIVTSERNKVVHWLKEGKSLKRIGSAVTILTFLIDLWSEYALNDKLKQIQEQLQRMEGKIDAEYFARFRSAHDSLKNAFGAVDEDNRVTWFRKSIELFQDARNETFHRLLEIVKKNHAEYIAFHTSRLRNTEELLNIYNNLRSIQDHSDRISHCYRAEARIHERLNEFGNAARLRLEVLDFHLEACEYLMFFGVGGSSYHDLGIVRAAGVDTEKVMHSNGGTELHENMKAISRLFSYSLREKLSSTPADSAFWRMVRTTADYGLAIPDLPGTAAKYLWSLDQESVKNAYRGIEPVLQEMSKQVPAQVFELT